MEPESAVSWPEPDARRAEALREYLARWDLSAERLAVFDQALTHSSYAFENKLPGDNERLEFLGDSIIGFSVSVWLFQTNPGATEGELSKTKSILVSRSILGLRAQAMELEGLLRLGKGDIRSGARKRSSVLGSALEAFAGAIYQELGEDAAREFVIEKIAIPSLEYVDDSDVIDHKSRLQELVQQHCHETPVYEIVSQDGPDHDKTFVVRVTIQGEEYGQGQGRRKKTAENQAARVALDSYARSLEPGK